MRHLLVILMMLGTVAAHAMKCDVDLNCIGSGFSKNDIKELSSRLKDHKFNGLAFDLKTVQKYFENNVDDYDKYRKQKDKFDYDYGTSKEAALLFDLAKADHFIKKYEKERQFVFSQNDQVVTDYRFIGEGNKQILGKPDTESCILDVQVGAEKTECSSSEGPAETFGSILSIASKEEQAPNDETNPENTFCITQKPVQVLVKTVENGEFVIYAADFMAEGKATELDNKAWFKDGLKIASRNKCESNLLSLEQEVRLYSCKVYDPWPSSRIKADFIRSPAVIEKFGKGLTSK